MRLRLQPNTDVLDRRREHSVHDAGERARGVVLSICQWFRVRVDFRDGFPLRSCVAGFKGATRVVEAAELDGDAGADSYERGQGSFVEGESSFVFEDLRGAV